MRFKVGDIVRHFKFEECYPSKQSQNWYTYIIEGFATDTETLQTMVVYRALYDEFKLWVRPLSDFDSPVDKERFPHVKQKMKYEVIFRPNSSQEDCGEPVSKIVHELMKY